jgi:Zn-dependent peptidase ImmA (M78 family)
MLTKEQKVEIKGLADKTRSDYQTSKIPPYNPTAIATSLGIQVLLAKFANENISAALFLSAPDQAKPKIYIKTSDNPFRQNFSVAHEIGHYILHKKNFVDEPEQFWRDEAEKKSDEELEANFFAAELLMPEEIFRVRWQEANKQPEELSREFAVSVSAILFRARDLELF